MTEEPDLETLHRLATGAAIALLGWGQHTRHDRLQGEAVHLLWEEAPVVVIIARAWRLPYPGSAGREPL